MRFKRWLVAIGVALLGAFGFVALDGTPALASYSQCATTDFCVYDYIDGGGSPLIYYSPGWAHTGCQNVPPSVNDRITSAINWFSSSIAFYRDINCGGFMFTLSARTAVSLGLLDNNKTSSFYFY